MSKLDELIKQFCPNGVEYRKIEEITSYEQPTKYIVNSTKYNDDFDTPVLTAGHSFILGYTNEIEGIYRASDSDPVIIFDDFTGAFKWVNFPFKVKSSAMKMIKANKNFILIRYLFHLMGYLNFSSSEHKRLWLRTYSQFEVPVPPIEVQREIVRILDNFTVKIDELKTKLSEELADRKKQYEYYRNKLLTFPEGGRVRWAKLEEIAEISTGTHNTNEELSEGMYPFYVRSQDVRRLNCYDYDETAIITSGDGVGVGKVMHYVEGKYALHQRAYRIHITDSNLLPKYYFHYMKSAFLPYIEKSSFHSSVTSVRRPMMNSFPVPVPSLEVQQRLVNVLDNFDAICSDLNIGLPAEIEARQKQYEFYRDYLLTCVKNGGNIARITDHGSRITDHGSRITDLIKLIQYVFGYIMMPLSEMCNSVSSGKAKTKLNDGAYPVYGSTGIIARTNHAAYEKENILVARVGANAGYTHLAEGLYDVSDNTLIVDVKDSFNMKYVYYQLVNANLHQYAKGGGQPLVTAGQIKKIKIPVPLKNKQDKIVTILDHFDTLCNDLSQGLPAEIDARQKQYEYYRDKLLNFKEANPDE